MRAETDDQRWGAMWLRWACHRPPSMRTACLSSVSSRTIEKQIRLNHICESQDEMVRDISHKTIMVKAGAMLGIRGMVL